MNADLKQLITLENTSRIYKHCFGNASSHQYHVSVIDNELNEM
jgi:hypothetical protein